MAASISLIRHCIYAMTVTLDLNLPLAVNHRPALLIERKNDCHHATRGNEEITARWGTIPVAGGLFYNGGDSNYL